MGCCVFRNSLGPGKKEKMMTPASLPGIAGFVAATYATP
jgi:hypothetical protein